MFLGSCAYFSEYASLIGMTYHTHEREKQNKAGFWQKKKSPYETHTEALEAHFIYLFLFLLVRLKYLCYCSGDSFY